MKTPVVFLCALLAMTVTADHHADHHDDATPAREPSECELWRERSIARPIVGGITPECEVTGEFKALQCHSPNFCQCWRADGRPITQASNTIKVCECIRQQAEAEAPGSFHPECRANGTYHERQCWASTNECWCSDHAGNKLTEPVQNEEVHC